jgi:hypothetical protein
VRLGFFAKTDVEAYTELTWDYGYDGETYMGNDTFVCRCGESCCKGELFSAQNERGGGEEEEVARIPFEKTEPVEKTESSIKEEAQAVPQMAGQEAQAVPQVYAAAHEVHTVVQEASI